MPGPAFFVSYAKADQSWAEWLAWRLEAAGWRTVLQAWDFRPGSDFVQQMHRAVQQAERTIAVLSPAYLESAYASAEWGAVFTKDPTGDLGLLIPVRVADCHPEGLLAGRVSIDLVGLDEEAAGQLLLEGVRQGDRPGRPSAAPAFPGAAAGQAAMVAPPPPFPGLAPEVSNLAPRNPYFAGRDDLIDRLAGLLATNQAAVVTAHGLGGIGKTQLALEFAHRNAGLYELIWWVPAENELLVTTGLAALAPHLGLPTSQDQTEQAAAVMAELGRPERRGSWLLVFDNADDPRTLARFRPAGGHVLLTSRNPAWGTVATRLQVDVLPAPEAVEFLITRTGDDDRDAAAELAAELGGLPLALEQAGAYGEQTGVPLAEYLALYRRNHAELLAHGQPADYPATVATTWRLNVEEVAKTPAAVQLLRLTAFLASEPIPLILVTADPEVLPPELGAAVKDELILNEAVGALRRYSLVGRDRNGLRVHRLVQVVVRANLDLDQRWAWAGAALRLVSSGFPRPGWDVTTWQVGALLLPHALEAATNAEQQKAERQATSALLSRVGGYLTERAQLPAARAAYERALRVDEGVLGNEHPDIASRLDALGSALERLGDLTGARSLLERALGISEAAHGPDHTAVADVLRSLAWVLQKLQDRAGARAALERALRIDQAILGPDHPIVALDLSSLGILLLDVGDFEAARDHYERALRIDEAAYGSEHPTVAAGHGNIGFALRQLGDLAGARAHLELALRIDEAVHGAGHPRVAKDVSDLGGLLLQLGDLSEARVQFDRALRIHEAIYGSEHPAVASDLHDIGYVLERLGDLPGARSRYERALQISRAVYGPDHPAVARDARSVGHVLGRLDHPAGAQAQFDEALRINLVAYGPSHPAVVGAMHVLGQWHHRTGNLAGAKAYLELALDIAEAQHGPGHLEVAYGSDTLGLVLEDIGDRDGARACYARALAIYLAVHGPDSPNTRWTAAALNRLGGTPP